MIFRDYVADNNRALLSVQDALLDKFASGLRSVRDRGGVLYVLGNGGSAATASHAVADFTKTAKQFGGESLKCIAISEMVSLQTAYANDQSFEVGAAETIRSLANPQDALLLVSVSGISPNIVACFNAATDLALTTFTIFGSRGKELAALSDHGIVLDSDDYQVVENAQLTLIHWLVKVL